MSTSRKHDQIPAPGVPGSQQDSKRRLGQFQGAGEHARVGSRTAGIVGQTKRKNGTDKGKAKK